MKSNLTQVTGRETALGRMRAGVSHSLGQSVTSSLESLRMMGRRLMSQVIYQENVSGIGPSSSPSHTFCSSVSSSGQGVVVHALKAVLALKADL